MNVVIFGGTGFIGSFFARFLLDEGLATKIYLIDIQPFHSKESDYRKRLLIDEPRVEFCHGDVRDPITWFKSKEKIQLIANFAAVHREPGHELEEYYETNLLGAQNVCDFAAEVNCGTILFTSSIAPYGLNDAQRDESSLPTPATAYGGSKLVAEWIHRRWQAHDNQARRLVIVRPGVVFGAGEGGNVARLIKAVLRRYFVFIGNQDTRKAGIYVKELCSAMVWAVERQKVSGERVTLFNGSMNPGPSVKEYVDAVCRTAGVQRFVPSFPLSIVLLSSYAIDALARFLHLSHPFSPVRIHKLVRSNDIRPRYLVDEGYVFDFTLDSAMADWRKIAPEEW